MTILLCKWLWNIIALILRAFFFNKRRKQTSTHGTVRNVGRATQISIGGLIDAPGLMLQAPSLICRLIHLQAEGPDNSVTYYMCALGSDTENKR